MPERWVKQLSVLGVWIAGAVVMGLAFGYVAWWLVAALAGYIAMTLHKLRQLDRFLDGDRRVSVFGTRGLWAEIFARIEKLRVKARQRKKKHHRMLREVRESTGALRDGGVILNADNEIVWFNPAATRLLGLDPRTDVGNRIDNLVRYPEFVQHLAGPGGESVVIPSPRDPEHWVDAHLIPYGRDQRIVILRDVTHEVNLERARRDFVANASHELRSPLTVIGGYLDTLADDEELPESWRSPIAEMLRQVDRMTQILRDLIELTRLESAESEAGHEFVDVRGMLEQIRREFAARSAVPSISLELETDAALLGNESELHSIFHNLVNNAVRFTPPNGRIEIRWRLDGNAGVFSVTDTGIGVAKDQIPRLTERFYRVDPGRSRATGGTGLGLAIVKHGLQRHGGTLEIESTEGEGSTFRCRFGGERLVLRGEAAEAVV